LKIELYDNRRIEKLASTFLNGKSKLKLVDEEAPGLLQRLLSGDPEEYFAFTESIIYEIAERGNGVIMGHAAQMLLRDFDCTLKILIHETFDDRIKNVMDEKKLTHTDAEKIIKQSDVKRKEFFKYIFKKDWESADIYDLVINTSKMSYEKAAEIIVDMLKSDIIHECSMRTLKNMKKLSLEKRVASVLLDNNFSMMDFKIKVDERGIASIVGYVDDKSQAGEVKEILSGINGIKKTKTKFKVKIPYQGFNGYSM
jgi:hypothetical protein